MNCPRCGAENPDDSWNLQMIEEAGNFSPWKSAIALGQGNEVHICYFRHYYYESGNQDSDYSFRYTVIVDGVWSTERVSSTFSLNGRADTSIAVDQYGRAHMTFPKLDAAGHSHIVCAAKKTSQGVTAESLAEALRNTALLLKPAVVISAAAYTLVRRRRKKEIQREIEQNQTCLHDHR